MQDIIIESLKAVVRVVATGAVYTITVGTPITPGPDPSGASVLLVSGQSNMYNLEPFMTRAGVQWAGFAEGAQPISFWDVGGRGWTTLQPLIANKPQARAFVWFQGESDNINGTDPATYQAKLIDVIQRVRAQVGNSMLPIWICQLNPQFTSINRVLISMAGALPNVTLVPTADLEWAPDNVHLDDYGATTLVARLKAMAGS